jgi:hypothetical protein
MYNVFATIAVSIPDIMQMLITNASPIVTPEGRLGRRTMSGTVISVYNVRTIQWKSNGADATAMNACHRMGMEAATTTNI